MYSKTQGHHCWWLNKNGKALANFDNEKEVDAIIEQSTHIEFLQDKIKTLSLDVTCHFGAYLVNSYESYFPSGEDEVAKICSEFSETLKPVTQK